MGYTLRFKNLETGELYPEQVLNAAPFEWANDNATIFYSYYHPDGFSDKVYRHQLGTNQSEDALVFHEEDHRFNLSVTKSKSGRYLYLYLESRLTTEVHFLEAEDPLGAFQLACARRSGIQYFLLHQGDRFLIRTNDEAPNFRLMEAPVANPCRERWEELIPNRDDTTLESVEVFARHFVLKERANGLAQLRVFDSEAAQGRAIHFPESAYALRLNDGPPYGGAKVRFEYTSMVTPKVIYEYDMDSHRREIVKRARAPNGYDPSQYQTERILAPAGDGTEVPIVLVFRKGLVRNGENPLSLIGYGSYGFSIDPWFSSSRLSLLDRGFVVGIAQVRGGGELGRSWHEGGRLFEKKNTFTDFIACAEHLIEEKYTSQDKLVITGGSAGGLLIGAVMNLRPDLARVAVAGIPFVDVFGTMLDDSIAMATLHYEEWGDPNRKRDYEYIKSYSPYENVRDCDYPNLLIAAGFRDPWVPFWHPLKWMARLRAHQRGDNRLLLRMNMSGGHGSSTGRFDPLKDRAFEYAFVLDRLGMDAAETR